jgi:hypothetical protein
MMVTYLRAGRGESCHDPAVHAIRLYRLTAAVKRPSVQSRELITTLAYDSRIRKISAPSMSLMHMVLTHGGSARTLIILESG